MPISCRFSSSLHVEGEELQHAALARLESQLAGCHQHLQALGIAHGTTHAPGCPLCLTELLPGSACLAQKLDVVTDVLGRVALAVDELEQLRAEVVQQVGTGAAFTGGVGR